MSNLPANNRDSNRIVANNRLVYYQQTADRQFLEKVRDKEMIQTCYKPFQAGNIFTFEKIFKPHLPKHGRILEAGCGTAKSDIALRARGYDCWEVDFAVKSLTKVQKFGGPLRLFCGDLTAGGVSRNCFDAIISIGVVEHRREGPEPFLREKQRILKPGGHY